MLRCDASFRGGWCGSWQVKQVIFPVTAGYRAVLNKGSEIVDDTAENDCVFGNGMLMGWLRPSRFVLAAMPRAPWQLKHWLEVGSPPLGGIRAFW